MRHGDDGRHQERARGDFAMPGAEAHYPPDMEIEPVHLLIDLAVDLVGCQVQGTVTTTVEARRDHPARLRLDAVALDDVSVSDPDGRNPIWTYDGRAIDVVWDEPIAKGERRRLAVRYAARRPASGLYFSAPTEAYPDQPWLAVTDHETERARHWLPCIDQPSARPRLDFRLTADERFTVLANGELVDVTVNGDGTKTTRWRLDHPCPSYLTTFAVGEFVRVDDGEVGGVPLAYFACDPFGPDDLRRSFGRTGQMMRWMVDKLAMPFPFPKHYQVAVPGIGGAMEDISLVVWDDAFVLDETLAAEAARRVDEVNLHEMAHSYFGDAVVCRDYAHAWLKESWATYMEQAWLEDALGADEQQYQYLRDLTAYIEEADTRYRRPIVTREFNSSWEMYDKHLYEGGACRLHALRAEVGDEPFWAATRSYLSRYAGDVVETDDFRREVELASGKSLGRFFDQWFRTAGYPDLKVTFAFDAARGEGTFRIEQKQAASSRKDAKDEKGGKGTGPTFHFRSDVGWTVDGRAFTHPIEVTEPVHTVTVRMAKQPEQVRFDPLHKLPHKLEFDPGEPMLLAQLRSAPDVIGRVLAGRALAKSAKRQGIEAVADACRSEKFWGVRAMWAQALGEAGCQAAIDALVELIAWESDPMVMEHVFRAAGRYRDPAIARALEARLDAGVPYYRAKAAALESLGRQREEAPLERLAEAASVDGFGGVVQSGALRGLAETRRDEALLLLLERATYGATSNRARPAAVAGLGTMGRLQEKAARERVAEALCDLLRDPVPLIRSKAVAALQAMAATEAIPALEAYAGPLSTQEQVRVDRAVAGIRSAAKPRAAALEKELQEMREKLRELSDAVQKLEAKADFEGEPVAGGSTGAAASSRTKASGKKAKKK